MAVIDFRLRPPYKNYLKFFQDADGLKKSAERLGLPYAESIRERSEELFIKELDEGGIDIGVIPGRQTMGVTNEELFEFADKYPGRFYIYPNVNALDTEASLETIDRYVVHGKGKGISIEPTVGPPEATHAFNDERTFPVYEKLQEHDIPVMLTYSAFVTENIDDNYNLELDLLAQAFPNLRIIIAHAGWPWFKETIGIAFRRKNVYLLPDVYANGFAPFAEDMRLAAKYLLSDQILFGTAYPIAPITGSIENARKWDLTEEGKEKFFY